MCITAGVSGLLLTLIFYLVSYSFYGFFIGPVQVTYFVPLLPLSLFFPDMGISPSPSVQLSSMYGGKFAQKGRSIVLNVYTMNMIFNA